MKTLRKIVFDLSYYLPSMYLELFFRGEGLVSIKNDDNG